MSFFVVVGCAYKGFLLCDSYDGLQPTTILLKIKQSGWGSASGTTGRLQLGLVLLGNSPEVRREIISFSPFQRPCCRPRNSRCVLQPKGRMPVKQIIEARYIEREKLMKLLRETFGEGKFHVRVGVSCSGNRDLQIRLLNVLYSLD